MRETLLLLLSIVSFISIGCGSVVVENTAAGSESAASSSTGSGGASGGMGSLSSGTYSTSGGSGGTGGATDCSAPKVTALAAKQSHPAAIALDAGNVYWMNAGAPGESPGMTHVFSIPKSGGAPVEIAATKGDAYTVLVDDARVYWVVFDDTDPPGNGILYAMPKAGGPVTKLFTAKSHFLFALTMDDDRFYWQNGKGQILSLPKAGGETTLLAENATFYDNHGIVVSQDRIYWKDTGGETVMSTPKLGGASQVVTEPGVAKGDFTVDDTQVFWAAPVVIGEKNVSAVFALPKSGGEPVDILHDANSAYNLLPFGSCLYWDIAVSPSGPTEYSPGWDLHAAPKSGGEPLVLFHQGNSNNSHKAADASGVYWVDRNSGTVMKATK